MRRGFLILETTLGIGTLVNDLTLCIVKVTKVLLVIDKDALDNLANEVQLANLAEHKLEAGEDEEHKTAG